MNYRLFVCIELPERELRRLDSLQTVLKRSPSGVRWVAPSSVHLTLAFLGETPEERVAAIAAALDAAASTPRFEIALRGAGGFPTLRRPRVLWIGIGGDTVSLRTLQGRVAEELEQIGFPREDRPFSPHLTLGRVKDDRDPALRQVASALEAQNFEGDPFPATEIVLMRSELGPQGARYTPLHRAALASPDRIDTLLPPVK